MHLANISPFPKGWYPLQEEQDKSNKEQQEQREQRKINHISLILF
jgi:hypothetical protein